MSTNLFFGRTKVSKILITIISVSFSLLMTSQIYALPEGEQVVSGEATFTRPDPNTLNVNTPSDRLIAEYNSFSIAQPEAVHFYQPSSSSIALNRVVGVDPSSIFGTLTANGRIFLINPNGVLFGPGSHVDVAALTASTLNISNQDFLAGNFTFNKVDGKAGASILNEGYLKAGSVTLVGQAVANSGIIEATLGSVALASGDAVTLNLDSVGMVSVVIAEPVKEAVLGKTAAVENSGQILADGGKVVLSANTLNNIFDYAINQTGIIQANTLDAKSGSVELVANQRVNVAGEISALGGTVKVDSEGANFSGVIKAATSILNMHGGDTIINPPGPYEGDTTFVDQGNINVIGDVIVNNGNLKILADHTSADINSWDDGNGDLTTYSHIEVTGNYNITLAGVNIYLLEAPTTVISDTGNIDIVANNSEGSSDIDISTPITSNSGNISISATAASTNGDSHALVQINSPISTNGNVNVSATNTADYTVDAEDESDWSENYAEIDVYNTISTHSEVIGKGNITLDAVNTVTRDISGYAEYFEDESENYAYIDVDNSIKASGQGALSLSTNNTVTANVDGAAYEYYDYSENASGIDIDASISTAEGNIELSAVNTVKRTITEYPDENEYDYFEDDFENFAMINVYSPLTVALPLSGDITLSANNSFTDTAVNRVGDKFVDAGSYNYAEIYTDATLSTANGSVSLSATNTVTRLGNEDYTDYSFGEKEYGGRSLLNYGWNWEEWVDYYYVNAPEDYASIDVNYSIYATDTISLNATNTINDSVNRQGNGTFEDYSYNYAEIYTDYDDTLSTDGSVDISASNTVNYTGDTYYNNYYDGMSMFENSDYQEVYGHENLYGYWYPYWYYIYYYTSLEAPQENYAYIDIDAPVNAGGAVSINATNSVSHTGEREGFASPGNEYHNHSDNYAEIDIYDDINSSGSTIDIAANNSVTEDGLLWFETIYNESDNYAEVYVSNSDGTTISTNGSDITIAADNSVTRNFSVPGDISYYYDDSQNYAELDINDTITTVPEVVAEVLVEENTGAIQLSATNNVSNTLTVEGTIGNSDYSDPYENYSENYAEIYLDSSDTLKTDAGNITVTADNTYTGNLSARDLGYPDGDGNIGGYNYEESNNYAYIDIENTPIYSNSGDITISAVNRSTFNTAIHNGEDSAGVYYYEDDSDNYAEIDIYNESGRTISTLGNIDISATNTADKTFSADNVYDYYEDYSDNYAEIDIEDTLDTRAEDGSGSGTINLLATNTTDLTVTLADYIDEFETEGENYAYIDIYDASLYSDAGDINIGAANSYDRNLSAKYIDYVYEENENYAEVDLYYTPIYSDSGKVSLSADNRVDTLTEAMDRYVDGEGNLVYNGGIYEYEDYSDNYAEIYVFNNSGSTISTAGGIDLTASDTVTKEITADAIDYLYDDSDNEAYVDVYDTLDTRSGDNLNPSSGAINLSATNVVDTTVDVAKDIGEYEDDTYNYAEIEVGSWWFNYYYGGTSAIDTDSGDINLTAANTFTRDISATYIDDFGNDDYDNEAYIEVDYTPIASQSGAVTLAATNTVDSTITATGADAVVVALDGDGASGIYEYDDDSYNYAEIDVDSISTTGNIGISAANDVTKEVRADVIEDYYEEDSDNEAYIYVYGTLNTSSEDGTSPGTVSVSSTNTIDSTVTVEGGIGDYYDYLYNDAEVETYDTISTDTGAVTLAAANTYNREVTASSIGGRDRYDYVYTYDYNGDEVTDYYYHEWSDNYNGFEDEYYNYAYVDAYGEINSGSGNVTLSATNTVDSQITATAADVAATVEDSNIGIGYYEDYSENYAEVYADDYISTTGNIDISAANNVTKSIVADSIGGPREYGYEYIYDYPYYDGYGYHYYYSTTSYEGYNDDSDNYAYAYAYYVLDTRSGDEENPSSGTINVSATNTVNNTVTVENGIGYYEDDSYNDAEAYLEDYTYSDLGAISLTAANTVTRNITASSIGGIGGYEQTQEYDYDGEGTDYYSHNWSDDYYGFKDDYDNYAYAELYYALTSGSGNVTLSAANTVDNQIITTGGEAIAAGDGSVGIGYYYDYSENYAEVYTDDYISTTGNIDISAANNVTREIITDSIGGVDEYGNENWYDYPAYFGHGYYHYYTDTSYQGFDDYSENEAYAEVEYPLDTRSPDESGSSLGTVSISASNSVDSTVTVENGIGYYYDDSYNYAEAYTDNNIYTDTGAITLTAENSVTRNISASSIGGIGGYETTEEYDYDNDGSTDYYYHEWNDDYYGFDDDYSNYAYAELYSGLSSLSGNVVVSAANIVDTRITATGADAAVVSEDGAVGIGYYNDNSDNYAEAYTSGYISTTGNIDISAANDVSRDIATDKIGGVEEYGWEEYYYPPYYEEASDSYLSVDYAGFDDYSENEAYVDVYYPLDTRSGDSENPSSGTINVSATNTVDSTVTVENGIGYYYDDSENYAEVNFEEAAVYSDTGDINLAAANNISRNVSASYIDDYFEDDSENYAYLDSSYSPIYSGSGNITLSATNTVDTATTVTTDAADGEISEYYDDSYNYARVNVYNSEGGTLSTVADILLEARNDVTKDVATDYLGYYEDDSENDAYVYVNDTVKTTLDAEEETSGAISIAAVNIVSANVSEAEESYDNSENYAEINLGGSDTIMTDNGNIDLTALSTGPGWNEADIYIYTPVISDTGAITVTAQADDYAEIGIYGYDYYYNDSYSFSENGGISTHSGDITLNANATEGSEAYIDIYGPVSSNSGNINIAANGSDEAGIEIFGGNIHNYYSYLYDYWYYGGHYVDGNSYWYDYYYAGGINTISGNINLAANSDSNAYINVYGPVSSETGTIGMTAHGSSINVSDESNSNSDSGGYSWDYGWWYYGNYSWESSSETNNAGSISNGSGNINLSAIPAGEDSSSISVTGTVSTDTGNINMIADDYNIGGDTVISYEGGNITLANASAGRPIAVGYNTEDDDMELDSDELDRIQTAGLITIGSNTAGPMGVASYNFGETSIQLITGDTINVFGTLATTTGDIIIHANDYVISGDTILSDTGDITLANTTAGRAIALGTNDTPADDIEIDDSEIANIVTNGAITIGSETAGAITLVSADFGTHGVRIITGGSILPSGSGPQLTAGTDSLLQAGGVIASLFTPLDVLMSGEGNLGVTIFNEIGGVSGALTGTTPSGTLVVNNEPPGAVYFNDILVWGAPLPPAPAGGGGPSGLAEQQGALLFWRFVLPTLENLTTYNVNPNDLAGPVFFYHPLTEADWSAFDQFILEPGAYEFIENSINLLGHEGLKPLLEEIKNRSGR